MIRRFISVSLALIIVLSLMPIANVAAANYDFAFSDMPNNWAREALESAVANGLLTGYEGKIMPDSPLTRAQMAAIITRAFGANEKADISSYSDLKNVDSWVAESMAKALKMGVMQGYADKMEPYKNITREQAFVVLARALKLDPVAYSIKYFEDTADISDWAKGYIYALVNEGYIQGSNSKINPQSSISRAEFAQLMYNVIKQYINTAGEFSTVASGNIMINVPGVVLKDVTINGDLIVGDGVGDGNVILDNITVNGRLLVRGGGLNSVIIIGGSIKGKVVIAKVNGNVRVSAVGGADVDVITVEDGRDTVIIEGTVGNVEIKEPNIPVTVQNATINDIKVRCDGSAYITVSNSGNVRNIIIADNAKRSFFNINGEVSNIVTAAPNTLIYGTGKVSTVTTNTGADFTSVNTSNTVVKNNGATGVTAGGLGVSIYGSQTTGSDTSNTGSTGYDNIPVYIPVPISGDSGEYVPIRAISIYPLGIEMPVGSTRTLWVNIAPVNATNQKILWQSSNKSVAIVDENGFVRAVGKGKTIITAIAAENPSITATCEITVIDASDIELREITLVPAQLELSVGSTSLISVTFYPANATNRNLIWESSDTSVATVNTNGYVYAVGKGSATITATSAVNSAIKATCTVTVKETESVPLENIILVSNYLDLVVDQTTNIWINYTPYNATNKKVTIEVSDENILAAQLSETFDGVVVTAKRPGIATITITSEENQIIKATCLIRVIEKVPVEGLSLSSNNMYLKVGQSGSLTANISPYNATNKSIIWSSSNNDVAYIIGQGSYCQIIALNTGEAIITATSEENSTINAVCKVKVYNQLYDLADTSWYDENQDTYTIYTLEELIGLSKLVNDLFSPNNFAGKTIILGSNIDLNEFDWIPIGTKDTPFRGRFNGSGKTISNLTINAPNSSYVGLFGYVDGGSLSNITIIGAINAKEFVGTLAGYATNLNEPIANIYGYAQVNAISYTGGIVGYSAASFKNCTSYVNINLKYDPTIIQGGCKAGGITGYQAAGNFIYSDCNVIATINAVGDVGGLVGESGAGVIYKNCTVSGTIKADNSSGQVDEPYAGGVIGRESGDVDLYGCTVNATVSSYKDGFAGRYIGGQFDGIDPKYVAMSNNVYFTSLKEAIKAAAYSGYAIYILKDCTFESVEIDINYKTLIINGYEGLKPKITFSPNCLQSYNGSFLYFRNVELEFENTPNYYETGLSVFSATMCNIYGQYYDCAESITFDNCVFYQQSTISYNACIYKANVSFRNCEFYCNGRCVLIKNNGETKDNPAKIEFSGCEFYSNVSDPTCAAINISTLEGASFDVLINGCYASGFDDQTSIGGVAVIPGLVHLNESGDGILTVKLNGLPIYPAI